MSGYPHTFDLLRVLCSPGGCADTYLGPQSVVGETVAIALGGTALALSVAAVAGVVVAMTRSVPAVFRRTAQEAQDAAIHLEAAFQGMQSTVSATLEAIEIERDAVRRERKRIQTRQATENGRVDGPPDPSDTPAYVEWLTKQYGGAGIGM